MITKVRPGGRHLAKSSQITLAELGNVLRPIYLDEVLDTSALQTRLDRKYMVTRTQLDRMVSDLGEQLACLEISGIRAFNYRSVYFDTADLAFFRQHAQGRRNRLKVRTRTYLDSAISFVEVKSKGRRGMTVKNRMPYPLQNSDRLSRDAEEFVAETTESLEYAGRLHASLESTYRRMTLIDSTTNDRVTCDENLRFAVGAREMRGRSEEALLETKTPGAAGSVDKWLLANGIRAHSVSKYCVGIGLLYPQAKANRWHRTLRRHFDWEPDAGQPKAFSTG